MNFDGVQVKNELEAEKVFLQGNDKNGRPVVVILAAKHDANKRKFDEFKRKISFVLICLTQNLNIIIGFPFPTSHFTLFNISAWKWFLWYTSPKVGAVPSLRLSRFQL